MNILRTIQKEENEAWPESFFEKDCPGAQVPLPFKLGRPAKGGYVYFVYKGEVVGFGLVDRIEQHEGMEVGTEGPYVRGGDNLIIEGHWHRMPFDLPCKGFQGIRYTNKNLHELSKVAAIEEIRHLKLEPKGSRLRIIKRRGLESFQI
jgi:hypothetical protein